MIISITTYKKAIERLRFDAEYYTPEFIETEVNLKKLNSVQLKDVAEFSRLRFNPETEPDKQFRYIDITNINTTTGDILPQNIKGYEAPSRARKVVKKDFIIISTVRPNRNAVAIIPEGLDGQICSTGFAVIKPKKVNPWFLFAYLKSKFAINQLVRIAMASMYPAVSEQDMGEILVPQLSDSLQRSIESMLKESQIKRINAFKWYEKNQAILDRLIGGTKSVQKNTKTFETKFGEIEERWDAEYYDPKFMTIVRKLKSNKDFDVISLSDIASRIHYGTSEDVDYVDKGIPFLRLIELNEISSFDFDGIKYIREADAARLRAYSVTKGDILISRTGTVGKAVFIDQKLSGSIFGSYFIRVKLKPNSNPLFVACFINSAYGNIQAEQKKTGSVQTNLTIPAIESLKIIIPSMKIQDDICNNYEKTKQLLGESKNLLKNAISNLETHIRKPS